MRNFIKLSHDNASYNHYIIDVDLIDYISDKNDLELGAYVYLKGKEKPLCVGETADAIYRKITSLPKETPSIDLQLSWCRRK